MVEKYSYRRDQSEFTSSNSNHPSFSSTLLDAIYRSIDEGEDEMVIYREGIKKKQSTFSDEIETETEIHYKLHARIACSTPLRSSLLPLYSAPSPLGARSLSSKALHHWPSKAPLITRSGARQGVRHRPSSRRAPLLCRPPPFIRLHVGAKNYCRLPFTTNEQCLSDQFLHRRFTTAASPTPSIHHVRRRFITAAFQESNGFEYYGSTTN
ncbi:hypothetical protein ACS0TY_023983 [Phlomoides rotata]